MSSISQVYFTKKSFPKPYYSQEQSSMDHSLKNYDLTLPSSTFPQSMLTVPLPLPVSPSVLFCLCSVFITFSIFPLPLPSYLYLFLSLLFSPPFLSLFLSLPTPIPLSEKSNHWFHANHSIYTLIMSPGLTIKTLIMYPKILFSSN